MALENEVAALVTSTTALQNEVRSQLAKGRAENTIFQATVLPKSGGTMTGALVVPSVTTTSNSVINGINIGKGLTNKDSNTVLGIGAASSLSTTDGVGVTAIGLNALKSNTTGSWNTAVGREALSANTSGSGVTAIGNGALIGNTTGSHNIGLGFHSLGANTTGYNNTATGSSACLYTTIGRGNSGYGYESLVSNVGGDWNTALGHQCVYSNTMGHYNTGVGCASLSQTTVFNNCSALGYNAQVSGSNQIQLGDAATTTFTYGAVQNRSDARDKADIQPTVLGLDFIKALKPKDFRWDMRDAYRTPMPEAPSMEASDEEKRVHALALQEWQERNKFANLVHDGSKKKKRIHHGLIAQEVAELIKTTGIDFGGYQNHKMSGGDDVLSIGYDELIAPLIKAVQELAQKVEELRAKIDT